MAPADMGEQDIDLPSPSSQSGRKLFQSPLALPDTPLPASSSTCKQTAQEVTATPKAAATPLPSALQLGETRRRTNLSLSASPCSNTSSVCREINAETFDVAEFLPDAFNMFSQPVSQICSPVAPATHGRLSALDFDVSLSPLLTPSLRHLPRSLCA